MNTRKWLVVSGAMILALVLMGGGVGAEIAMPDSEPVAALSPVQAQAQRAPVVINEVMPKPDVGEYEWVELLVPRVYFVYLPVVLRGFPSGGGVGSGPVGLAGAASSDVDLDGYEITDEDGNTYAIPSELPPVPQGAFVLIYFSEGTDDYDFGDNKAVLYASSGLSDIFEDAGDQVALYSGSTHSADTIVDFVAWGIEPEEDAANAVDAGLWQAHWWVSMHVGSGAEEEGAEAAPNRSIGLYPGRNNDSPDDWAVYQEADLTPGAANPVPRAYWSTVVDGMEMGSDGFALGWGLVPGGTYHFQMDDDEAFGSPLVDIVLDEPWYAPEDPVPPGDYWWRVQTTDDQGHVGTWSDPLSVRVVDVAGVYAAVMRLKCRLPYNRPSCRSPGCANARIRHFSAWMDVARATRVRPVPRKPGTRCTQMPSTSTAGTTVCGLPLL